VAEQEQSERAARPLIADAVVLRHPDIEKPYICSPKAVPHWERRGWVLQTEDAPVEDPAADAVSTTPPASARRPAAAPVTGSES
jgi:hypothetical protein